MKFVKNFEDEVQELSNLQMTFKESQKIMELLNSLPDDEVKAKALEVLESFNFELCEGVMNYLDWKWLDNVNTPTKPEIAIHILECMTYCWDSFKEHLEEEGEQYLDKPQRVESSCGGYDITLYHFPADEKDDASYEWEVVFGCERASTS